MEGVQNYFFATLEYTYSDLICIKNRTFSLSHVKAEGEKSHAQLRNGT